MENLEENTTPVERKKSTKKKELEKAEKVPLTEQEIMVGTYEEFIIGYKISKKLKCVDEFELTQSFTARAHSGPIRSLVGVNKFLISGGSDEVCKIFDLSKRVEHGQLMHHEGTVSCLAAFGKTYLFSASDDNSLAVTKVGSWQVEKTLYKHQAGITALAVHPSGKLAFTAAKDRKLITWNLVKARPAFISNIKGIAEFLSCSPDGSRYCVGMHRRIDVYNMDSAGIEYTIDLRCRPNAVAFLDENIIAVGGESPNIQIHSLIEKSLIKEFPAHETRVRCLQILPETDTGSGRGEEAETITDAGKGAGYVLVSASSSDHMVKMWRIYTDKESEVRCIGSADTTCRVTCLTAWNPTMKGLGSKRKKAAVEDDASKSQKKIKFSETAVKERLEELTEVQEQTIASSPNLNKKKKKKTSNFVESENK